MHRIESHFINNQWISGGGDEFTSTDPASEEIVWDGKSATTQEIEAAANAARQAFPAWARTSTEHRAALVGKIVDAYSARKENLEEAICRETGKPRWEAATEVQSMIQKGPISIEANQQRCGTTSQNLAGMTGVTRYRPHGVLAVLGPFNFPGHLANGHILPSLLAGNCVIYKPSEQAPLVGQCMAEAFEAAGLPPGVINVIQGGRETGAAITSHREIDGVLFTGSWAGGKALNQSLADRPQKILALEMGGNNPLIVHDTENIRAAILMVIQSAYLTAGQRCSCARRLILVKSEASQSFIKQLAGAVTNIRIGFWNDEPAPFMGTVISARAANGILDAQARLIASGGVPIVAMKRSPRSKALLTPGLIDVSQVKNRPDDEIFGPLLQVIEVKSFDEALYEANRTAYGLSAGIITDREAHFQKFIDVIRAGVVSWNRPLTGASSKLPFGGVGQSGNHRPSGYFASDYVTYPVASLESSKPELPEKLPPGISL